MWHMRPFARVCSHSLRLLCHIYPRVPLSGARSPCSSLDYRLLSESLAQDASSPSRSAWTIRRAESLLEDCAHLWAFTTAFSTARTRGAHPAAGTPRRVLACALDHQPSQPCNDTTTTFAYTSFTRYQYLGTWEINCARLGAAPTCYQADNRLRRYLEDRPSSCATQVPS